MPCCQSYARIYARCFYVCNCPNVCIPKGAVQIHNVHTRVHIVATEGWQRTELFCKSAPRKDVQCDRAAQSTDFLLR